jgi:hypothetical protein
VAYPGHPGGLEELDVVEAWATQASLQGDHAMSLSFPNPQKPSPCLFALRKKADRRDSQS